ncbi:MAG: hypothetical protein GY795_28400 [Desulfobacterales bacterium]|nr:hypothetical protein [Desulfobacterales bacterium]
MKRFIIGFMTLSMFIMIAGISNAQNVITSGCAEDDSGSIDIAGTSAVCGGNISVPVRIQNAPDAFGSVGFEIAYNPAVLTYTGFEKQGTLTENFDHFDVSEIYAGLIRCGGFKSSNEISAGTGNDLVYLKFTVSSGCNESKLEIRGLKDDITSWSASSGCFRPAGKCEGDIGDISKDGEITPKDALCAFEKYMGVCPTSCGAECADVCCDVNSDSECTPADALWIFDKYLGNPVYIIGGPPVGEEFSIWTEHLNISGLWRFGLENIVHVSTSDYYGNKIPDGTAISFKTYNSGGLFVSGSGSITNGISENTLVSTQNPKPVQGFVSLTAGVNSDGRATHVTSLEVVPEHNQIVYAGTNGGGVYKSVDSGATWTNISRSSENPGQNWIHPYVNDIAVDPDNPNRIYAATGFVGKGHIYRSLDGGINWNSNDPEEYNGLISVPVSVLTVLCDDDGYDKSDELTGNDKCYNNRGYFNENGKFVCEGDHRDTDYQCEEFIDPNEVPCYRHVWFGTKGSGLYYSENGENFRRSEGLGEGKIVRDIVKVQGTHMKTARLYAGTATGVFKSSDGGRTWLPMTGVIKSVLTLALYPAPTGHDIIYAGTKGYGMWVSADSGETWFPYNSGLDNDLFGVDIRDILVDPGNDLLYAVTCSEGDLYPSYPVGNVFVHELENGRMAPGNWTEANLNLPQYQPEDTRLSAQYVLAPNIPDKPTALFIGGAGISLYKAAKGLNIGRPDWQKSQTGLTNLIMARFPVLFSGECTLDVRIANVERDGVDSGSQPINTPLFEGDVVTFHIYVQDKNGNPPVEGSALYMERLYTTPSGTNIVTDYSKTYEDALTSTGTWRDPNDMLTNRPVVVSSTMQHGMTVKIRYVSKCSNQVPGCSGGVVSLTFEIDE